MSDFKAKMHQIQFRPGLRSAPDPLPGLRGLLLGAKMGRRGKGKRREGTRAEWKEWEKMGWGRTAG